MNTLLLHVPLFLHFHKMESFVRFASLSLQVPFFTGEARCVARHMKLFIFGMDQLLHICFHFPSLGFCWLPSFLLELLLASSLSLLYINFGCAIPSLDVGHTILSSPGSLLKCIELMASLSATVIVCCSCDISQRLIFGSINCATLMSSVSLVRRWGYNLYSLIPGIHASFRALIFLLFPTRQAPCSFITSLPANILAHAHEGLALVFASINSHLE